MRASLFLSGIFAISSALGVVAETSAASDRADTSPLPALHTHEKRTICFFGICWGEPDYSSDTDNCGRRGNSCSNSWANGRGSQCREGVCMPGSCNSGWTLNPDSASCVNLANDVDNWQVPSSPPLQQEIRNDRLTELGGVCQATACGAGFGLYSGTCKDLNNDAANCGRLNNVCQFPGGSGICSNGACTFTKCSNGYYLLSGRCVKLDLQTDVNNCGTVGKVCSVANGVAGCRNGQCTVTSCATGYLLSGGTCVAIDTSSDVRNCGQIGRVCSFTNGAGICSSGTCTYTSCSSSSGLYLVDGQCVRVDLQNDPQNCGTFGKTCSVQNGVAGCSSGSCNIASCDSGYTLVTIKILWGLLGTYTTCQAVDTSSDVNNCGAVNNACQFTNGAGTCSNGVCTFTSCSTPGFYLVNNECVALNLQTDPQNCGAVGSACPSVPNGVAGCSSGTCNVVSCNPGYVKVTTPPTLGSRGTTTCQAVNTDSDRNNCGTIGNVCPSSYLNGGSGTCVGGRCQTSCRDGFDFDFLFNFCRPVTDDEANCGRCGQRCNIPNATSHVCQNGQCKVTACASGYTLSNNACIATNYQSDPKNCGAPGNVCTFTPALATGACIAGKCVVQTCPFGYQLVNGKCNRYASMRARAKRHTVTEQKTLCPAGEQACPIAGSTLFEDAVSQHFQSGEALTGLMARSGGYECLDTSQALESCGGCASTGEGKDCTAIPHAAGVGCEAGTCVVFSCAHGWKRSLAGDKCVQVRARCEPAFHLDPLSADLDLFLAQLSASEPTPSSLALHPDPSPFSADPHSSDGSAEPTGAVLPPSRPSHPTGFLDPSKPRIALDAPVQPRNWLVPASTGRKRLTVPLERRLAKKRARRGAGDVSMSTSGQESSNSPGSSAASSTSPPDIPIEDESSSAPMPDDEEIPSEILSAVERKRKQNTISARRCRARKQERVQELERENEVLRQRVRELEQLLSG
ncbi:hypothetical protein JCM3774_001152 [Rhodotorula dairenensis]